MKEFFHFIGIKGSGMSSLAQILFDNGYPVQGSDIEETLFTQKGLEKRGIKMFPFDEKNISGEHIYIIGNAFDEKNKEVKKVLDENYRHYRYHEFLGVFMQRFVSIGVSGTHGKTSTTSLLAHVLKNQFPTSALIGDGTGYGEKQSKFFAFEACEYKRHFLKYNADYSIITNVDYDHPDYFTGIEDVLDAFNGFAKNTKKKVIVCGDDLNTSKLNRYNQAITYGINEHNIVNAQNIKVRPEFTMFEVYFKGEKQGMVKIPQHGNHAIQNALAVITVCLLEGMSISNVAPHLLSFAGAKRRFNVEKWNDFVVVDDYAHHPKEIEVTIEAARQKFPDKQLVAVFQPHTYTRTATFLEGFKSSLGKADKVYGCSIFGSARESAETLSINHLTNLIPGSEVLTLETIDKLTDHRNAVLLFMGAGDIGKYIDAFKDNIKIKKQA
ncbi:UDP-N-acetylmuramate--L-alanine ligase [Bacillus mexicanus]|uniref:UDP-N-acetylmuramate--L-alanine ligase n=1 Tax=Bacillus mexicanus TaxID=2834415 RepID=UPI003D19549A